jgi:hypothetical protein
MALSQTQIIQSLAESLGWFEKELEWGVAPAELYHLTGRIGELYAAMITRVSLQTNQRGYDVISAENERISVKTMTTSAHVSFNPRTFGQVDRVLVLRLNIDDEIGVSVEMLLDCLAGDFLERYGNNDEKFSFSISPKEQPRESLENLQISGEAKWRGYDIQQFENGTIRVLISNTVQQTAM